MINTFEISFDNPKYPNVTSDNNIIEINADDENLESIEIDLTEEEFEMLKKAADSQGISVEQFLTNLLAEYDNTIVNAGEDLVG